MDCFYVFKQFQTFQERLSNINVDVARKVQRISSAPEVSTSKCIQHNAFNSSEIHDQPTRKCN